MISAVIISFSVNVSKEEIILEWFGVEESNEPKQAAESFPG